MDIIPGYLFHGTVRVVRPVARRGTQPIAIPRHHRLVLGLGDLIFAQVKSFGQGDLVLGFPPCFIISARFRLRTTHHKSARFHPDHFQTNTGIEIGRMCAGLPLHTWTVRVMLASLPALSATV